MSAEQAKKHERLERPVFEVYIFTTLPKDCFNAEVGKGAD